jgi:uncharacterized protein YkwD
MRNLFGVLIILLMAFFQYDVCAQPREALFSSPPDQVRIDLPSVNPHVVLRQRLVIVRPASLDDFGGSSVYLNPFDDLYLKAECVRTERNANGGLTWYGHIERSLSSEVVLERNGSKMAGSITTMDRKYTVRHLKDDLHLVRELDPISFQAASSSPLAASLAMQAVLSDYETDVLYLVNLERAAQNLHPLTWDNQLHDAALAHSEDMAVNNYFSHTSLDGRTASERIEDAGYSWSAAGENIASGYSTPQAVVNGWMNSDGHRQNILSSTYCDLGVGYAYDPSSIYDHYWTQDFGRRIGVFSCSAVANQPPSAGFMATPISGPSPLVVHFDASASVDPEGGLLSFEWNFGDGQTGSGGVPSHTYTRAGKYTVTLTVMDGGGASNRLERMNFITVSDPSMSKHPLIIYIEGQGTATMTPPDGSYTPGAVVTLTAIPNGGWEFSGWAGDLAGSDNPAAITMNSSKSLTATFTHIGNRDAVASGASGGGGCFISTIRSSF